MSQRKRRQPRLDCTSSKKTGAKSMSPSERVKAAQPPTRQPSPVRPRRTR